MWVQSWTEDDLLRTVTQDQKCAFIQNAIVCCSVNSTLPGNRSNSNVSTYFWPYSVYLKEIRVVRSLHCISHISCPATIITKLYYSPCKPFICFYRKSWEMGTWPGSKVCCPPRIQLHLSKSSDPLVLCSGDPCPPPWRPHTLPTPYSAHLTPVLRPADPIPFPSDPCPLPWLIPAHRPANGWPLYCSTNCCPTLCPDDLPSSAPIFYYTPTSDRLNRTLNGNTPR